jgi:hypothetical protein
MEFVQQVIPAEIQGWASVDKSIFRNRELSMTTISYVVTELQFAQHASSGDSQGPACLNYSANSKFIRCLHGQWMLWLPLTASIANRMELEYR